MSGKEQWEAETVAKALTKGPERRTVFETTSGIPVERLYTPEDAAGRGRRACPSPLISRRRSAMTRTTPWPMARWVR